MVTSSPGDSLDNSVGTNVSFTCEANGVGIEKKWYRNGEEVYPGPHVEIRGSNMTIYGLLEGDSGMYQCSVSNGTISVWRQWRVVVSSECMCNKLKTYLGTHRDCSIVIKVHSGGPCMMCTECVIAMLQ